MKNLIQRFIREEEGQDLIEYALLAALVAVSAVAVLITLSGKINNEFTKAADALT
jgi:pilus assembly protein Flp/PilA